MTPLTFIIYELYGVKQSVWKLMIDLVSVLSQYSNAIECKRTLESM